MRVTTRSALLAWCACATLLASAREAMADPPPAATIDPTPAAAPPFPPLATSGPKPPPLHVEYAEYGLAITAEMNVGSGATCPKAQSPTDRVAPCILGSGGGIALRGGYRSPGPWYIGGAYEFSKMDSSNLYRLGILQQLRAEMRYIVDTGYRTSPYFAWGVGGVFYGNEWGVETAGAMVFGGVGLSIEVSRLAIVGLGFNYKPVLIAGWTDTAGQIRSTGLAQFFSFELNFEVRSELGRR